MKKRICKVKPDKHTCDMCIDTQMRYSKVEDCGKCLSDLPYCELVELVINNKFLGDDYAVVLTDGKFTKVLLNRIFDVKEV